MKKVLGIVMIGIVALAVSATAEAAVISAADIANNGPMLGGTVSSTGDLVLKGRTDAWGNYFEGVGTQSGVTGEIDTGIDADEYIKISFAESLQISSISLGLLFPAGENTDMYDEIAAIEADGVLYTLMVTDYTTAVYSGSGSVVNLSPAQDGNGEDGRGFAAWQILDPFAGAEVSYVKFYAIDNGYGEEGAENSDFNIIELTSPVPEPATMALFGLGLIGLASRRRK